ncbi:MAG: hypothetical protein KGL95_07410 [Patescibacteria group bacterium]|nr:hypothetical protein [Patescibacteria group bacterium]
MKFLLVLPVLSVMLSGNAYAVYTGGANTASGAVPFSEVNGFNNFAGSTPSSMTSDLLSVISSVGWDSSTSSITPMIYQGALQLQYGSSADIYADAQVRYGGTLEWDCYQSSTCPSLDTYSNTNYAYQDYAWIPPSLGGPYVDFYSEVVDNSGYGYSTDQDYTPISGDNSDDFADGVSSVTAGSNTYYLHMLQFGAESDSSTSNWQMKQYSMEYYPVSGGTTSLASLNVDSVSADSAYDGGSWLTYSGTCPSSCVVWGIGSGGSYDVTADSHHSDSSVSDGTVTWDPVSSGGISDLTALWP